eukprot:Gb_32729 [translate_table: standard]
MLHNLLFDTRPNCLTSAGSLTCSTSAPSNNGLLGIRWCSVLPCSTGLGPRLVVLTPKSFVSYGTSGQLLQVFSFASQSLAAWVFPSTGFHPLQISLSEMVALTPFLLSHIASACIVSFGLSWGGQSQCLVVVTKQFGGNGGFSLPINPCLNLGQLCLPAFVESSSSTVAVSRSLPGNMAVRVTTTQPFEALQVSVWFLQANS